jgi:tRNA(Ile)-lysidine synthase
MFLLEGVCGRSGKMSKKLHPLEIQVHKTIKKYGMLSHGDLVLAAVSGGADSTALLLCLHRLADELNISIAVAHLNHSIRGAEGDADQEFVRQLSLKLELPFFFEVIEIKKQAAEIKENLEQFARRTRYNFLRKTASMLNAQKIAVGHSLNDQAETVLFRLLRGSGIQGLSAIHPIVGGLVIRPLLNCTRAGIIEYLNQKGAPYREDSTNKDPGFTRNRIRQELLPFLENNYNPRLIHTLSRTAELTRGAWSFIESEAKSAFETIHTKNDEGISLPVVEIARLHPELQKQVLRCALKSFLGSLDGITSQHINNVLSLCGKKQSGFRVPLPKRSIAIRQFDNLSMLKRISLSSPEFNYSLKIPGECFIPDIKGQFSAKVIPMTPERLKEKSPWLALLEMAALPSMLTIRSKAPGDRYGGSGHRKVKKMLIDRKIPLAQRPFLPMVVAGNSVVWIPGFRPAQAFKAKPASETCVALEFRMI